MSDPDWSFSPDHAVKCPECGATLSGLDWRYDTTGLVAAMDLVPCGHQLDTDSWELKFSGRDRGGDRRSGHIIRTPKFQRKAGS